MVYIESYPESFGEGWYEPAHDPTETNRHGFRLCSPFWQHFVDTLHYIYIYTYIYIDRLPWPWAKRKEMWKKHARKIIYKSRLVHIYVGLQEDKMDKVSIYGSNAFGLWPFFWWFSAWQCSGGARKSEEGRAAGPLSEAPWIGRRVNMSGTHSWNFEPVKKGKSFPNAQMDPNGLSSG